MFVSENLAISTLAHLNILGFYVIINCWKNRWAEIQESTQFWIL